MGTHFYCFSFTLFLMIQWHLLDPNSLLHPVLPFPGVKHGREDGNQQIDRPQLWIHWDLGQLHLGKLQTPMDQGPRT